MPYHELHWGPQGAEFLLGAWPSEPPLNRMQNVFDLRHRWEGRHTGYGTQFTTRADKTVSDRMCVRQISLFLYRVGLLPWPNVHRSLNVSQSVNQNTLAYRPYISSRAVL